MGVFFLTVLVLSLFVPQSHCQSSDSTTSSVSRPGATESQSKSQPSTSTTLVARSSYTHTILVGLRDHVFDPDTVYARVGDTIEFEFFPTNHSVVRAEHGHPCVPWEVWHPDRKNESFFSGFSPVDKVLKTPPSWQIVVESTEPMFFYCSAPDSCPQYMMVGAINPSSSTPLARQRALASQAQYSVQPGEIADQTELVARLGPEFGDSETTNSADPSAPTLSVGEIVGIALGATVLVCGLAWVFFYSVRDKANEGIDGLQLPPMEQRA